MKKLEDVFKEYLSIYQHIFASFYPSLGSTGFQERNLTVNFSKAYEKTHQEENVFSWFELQFGKKNNEHFDCLIVNSSKREIFFVESKRFTSSSKKKSICDDINRINDFSDRGLDLDKRFKKYKDYSVYGLILADVWQENKAKIEIYGLFKKKTYFDDVDLVKTKECEYYVMNCRKLPGCKHKYALLGFLWKVK